MAELADAGHPHGGGTRPFGFEADKVTHRPDEADVIRLLTARATGRGEPDLPEPVAGRERRAHGDGQPLADPDAAAAAAGTAHLRYARPPRERARPRGVGADHQRGGRGAVAGAADRPDPPHRPALPALRAVPVLLVWDDDGLGAPLRDPPLPVPLRADFGGCGRMAITAAPLEARPASARARSGSAAWPRGT